MKVKIRGAALQRNHDRVIEQNRELLRPDVKAAKRRTKRSLFSSSCLLLGGGGCYVGGYPYAAGGILLAGSISILGACMYHHHFVGIQKNSLNLTKGYLKDKIDTK